MLDHETLHPFKLRLALIKRQSLVATKSVIAAQYCCPETCICKHGTGSIIKSTVTKLLEGPPCFIFAAALVQHDKSRDLHIGIVRVAAQCE
jgi:hypothetical protein